MADALATPYASVAEADVYNAGNASWTGASTLQKEEALFYGRMYIDSKYTFDEPIDENDIDEAIKKANSMFALEYILNPTTFFNYPSSFGLKKSMVKADVVEIRKEFESSINGGSSDKFPLISAVLSPYAKFKFSSATVNITR